MEQEHLKELLSAVRSAARVLILTHNDPDPDAIGSALGLRELLHRSGELPVAIAYNGIIGRAENRALVRYLERPLHRLRSTDINPETALALVDTQPGSGNNPLPPDAAVAIVLDHHPRHPETARAAFSDVRTEIGATSTMVLRYLLAAGIAPSRKLATALFYGIKTDTLGLSRNVSEADKEAFFYLQSRIDTEALVEIERAQVPPAYFRSFSATLQAARVYDNLVYAYIGEMDYPDLAAEMADLLMRLKGAEWVVCTGVFKQHLILAVRSRSRYGGAGRLAQAIIAGRGPAGGHGSMAGGQVPLSGDDPLTVADDIRRNALDYFRRPPDTMGRALV